MTDGPILRYVVAFCLAGALGAVAWAETSATSRILTGEPTNWTAVVLWSLAAFVTFAYSLRIFIDHD